MVPLTLEIDMETHESVDSCNTLAVDPAIAASPGNFDLYEPGLTEKSLRQSLESGGIEFPRKNLV